MAATPYVRFFWSDWIADTSHLDLMQLGAYMRLLEHVYQHGRPIPGDLDRVYRICHATSPTEQTAIKGILTEYFVPSEDPERGPVWRHLRAEREMEWASKAHAEKSAKAKAAADARWEVERARRAASDQESAENVAVRHAPSIAQAMPEQCASNANQNQNQNYIQSNPDTWGGAGGDDKPNRAKMAPEEAPPGVDPQAWADYLAHRREIRKPLTAMAGTKAANILRDMPPATQRAAVDASIVGRWTGVFPPRNTGAQNVRDQTPGDRNRAVAERFVAEAVATMRDDQGT